jgi:predicted lipoprotein with Yx(FWY)xxD motif
VVRLGVQTGGSLVAKDFFAPANAPVLAAHDQDFGSGGPVALPFGTTAHPHLLMEAGKDGRIFLLDRDNLGGRNGTTDHPVYETPVAYEGQQGHPAAFAGTGGADYLYYHGGADYLRAFKFNTTTGKLTDAGHTPDALKGGSGAPVVTSNGKDPSSAVVWEVNRGIGQQGTLEAFDAIPNASGQLKMLWSYVIGGAIKFAVPATDSGRVYVGTLDDHVLGFGAPYKAPLSGTPLAFNQLAVGSSSCSTATVTATAGVTVTGVTASSAAAADPFTVNQPNGCAAAVTFPLTLAAGQTLTVPVTFAPTAPGGATGALAFATTTPNFSTVGVSVSGVGTQTGFFASNSSLEFGSVPTGSPSEVLQTVITNGGTAAETVTNTSAPTGPFSASGLPANGTIIQPGGSVTVSVTFQPTAAAGDTGSLSVTGSNGGTVATVNLAGTGVIGQGALSASPASASFGSVALGQQHTKTVTISNTGNLPMRISAFSAPTVPFGTPIPVTTGITLSPGDTAVLPVTFTPQSVGGFSGTYTLTASDGHNPAQKLTIPVAGRGTAPASGVVIPSPGGGWTLNGSAHLIGTTLRLTPPVSNKTGSAVYSQPLTSNGLQATFTARMGGGTGADGLTFALLDATKTTTASRGAGADKLGYGGLPGVAVALDTFPKQSVGIVTGQSASGLVYAAKTTSIPNLRSGTHVIGVTVTGSRIAVTVDGKSAVSASVPVPPTALVAFTAANGGLADDHDVSGVSIHTGAVRLPPPGGGWSYNYSALMAGPDTQLTSVSGGVGSVVYPAPIASNGLRVRFNEQIGGGTGGDGMTFALLSPTTANGALGSAAAGLGFAHLPGVAVVFDTHEVTGYPSSNFAAIATGVTSTGALKLTSSVKEIGQLRAGTHNVEVTVNGGVLVVYLDGAQILAQRVTLPRTVKLAFTAGSGKLTDMHTVRDAAISAGAPASSAGALSPGAASPAPPPAAAPPTPTVDLYTSANFSEVLTDSAGMTLYRQIAACSTCAAQYQPLLVASGQQLHMSPLLPGQLGTVRLSDGSLQLTYNGVRLFTYTGDHSPGDTNGVSLSWNVVQPDS